MENWKFDKTKSIITRNGKRLATISEPVESIQNFLDGSLISACPNLLAIAREIANTKCDLLDSERRIRLYAAIAKAEGGTK